MFYLVKKVNNDLEVYIQFEESKETRTFTPKFLKVVELGGGQLAIRGTGFSLFPSVYLGDKKSGFFEADFKSVEIYTEYEIIEFYNRKRN